MLDIYFKSIILHTELSHLNIIKHVNHSGISIYTVFEIVYLYYINIIPNVVLKKKSTKYIG